MAGDSHANELSCAPIERPERCDAVPEDEAEKEERADDISGGNGDALAVHLNSPLPLLEVKPRADKKTDDDRHGVAPVVPVVRWQLGNCQRTGALAEGMHGENHQGRDEKQEKGAMAEFDAFDVKFLAKQNCRRQHHKHRERQVEKLRTESKRRPGVADECKDRQCDREQLIKEKNQPERPRPRGKKFRQRLGSRLPPRQVVRDQAEDEKAQKIRDCKGQQPEESELRGELNREEQAEPPHPGKRNRDSPQNGAKRSWDLKRRRFSH